MPRIAAALLIVAAVLALNSGLMGGAFARDMVGTAPPVQPPVAEPGLPKSTKILSLLLVLESLRQAPVDLTAPKV